MSNFHFGDDDYDLNYYPPEASDGMGGVDWDKVELVEIEWVNYVKERTCGLRSRFTGMYCYECSECGRGMKSDWSYCPNCGAKVMNE